MAIKEYQRAWYETGRAQVWTPDRMWRLLEALEQGEPYERIAAQLDSTPDAVRMARRRARLPTPSDYTYSIPRLARAMGLGSSKPVNTWVQRGWLTARPGPRRGSSQQVVIQPEAVRAFLADWRYWVFWEPEAIVEPQLAAYAASVRNFRVYTLRELVAACGVQHGTVIGWVRRGQLAAERVGGIYVVSQAVVETFVPPGQREGFGRVPHPRWSAAEDGVVAELLAAGHSYRQIGERLGRSTGAVSQRVRRRALREGV